MFRKLCVNPATLYRAWNLHVKSKEYCEQARTWKMDMCGVSGGGKVDGNSRYAHSIPTPFSFSCTILTSLVLTSIGRQGVPESSSVLALRLMMEAINGALDPEKRMYGGVWGAGLAHEKPIVL